MSNEKRVAIIGAGPAGLAAARHVSSCGFDMDILEMKPELGGTWVYSDDVDTDQYGYPVHSAMYQGLRTNLPKEIMGYPDFHIRPEQDPDRSYLTQEEVLSFFSIFANHFNLRDKIKFNTWVTKIRPADTDGKWKITYIDKPTRTTLEREYDYVIICNGHYNDPKVPQLEGLDRFTGHTDHSRNYRGPERFRDKRVLLIGAGPSGLEMTMTISDVAENVVLSHHMPDPIATQFPANVAIKPDVKRVLDGNQVEFSDGTTARFDEILFCIGYNYSMPFLDESCGIINDDNHIRPLYNHMIHIDRPTMCFIGIPFNVCTLQMFDLQARYYCEYLKGTMQLPSTEDMRRHTDQDNERRREKGYLNYQMHMMGPDQQPYYDELARAAETRSIAPVMVTLRDLSVKRLYADLTNFREDQYRIIDDNRYAIV